MNGLMASLIILLLAGTAMGQQAADDAANTMPALRPLPSANSMSVIDSDNQFERPGPDNSVGDWPTPSSVLGDQATVTSSSASTGGQTTNFGGRSDRPVGSQPTSAQSQGIRFDVMLRPQDLESVKRGGTLVAPVDIRDRQNEMLSTDVVSDIAFFHAANKGKQTDGMYIYPEQIQPGSRKLRFKMTGEQLDQIDKVAYQFQVPRQMRGEFDEVEFYTDDVVADSRSGGTDLSGSWKTPSNSASNLPKPNDGGTRLGGPLRREGDDNGFGRDLKQPAGNDFGDLASKWERKNRFDNNSTRKPFESNPSDRFGNEGAGRGLDQGGPRQESFEMAEMRRKLAESQRLAKQALDSRKLWEKEADELAIEKSLLAKQKRQLETQLDAASRAGDSRDSTLMRPLDTKPFGADRSNFAPINKEQNPQLELAYKKIEQLEREKQLAKRENQALVSDYSQLETAAKDLLGKYQNEKTRRRSDSTTELIRNGLLGPSAIAGGNPAGNRFASKEFEPTESTRTLTGLGGTGANVGGNPNVGNPNLGSAPANNRDKTSRDTDSQRSKTDFFLWMLLLPSIGLNFYLSILCRSLYVRYQDLADELREMFSATSA